VDDERNHEATDQSGSQPAPPPPLAATPGFPDRATRTRLGEPSPTTSDAAGDSRPTSDPAETADAPPAFRPSPSPSYTPPWAAPTAETPAPPGWPTAQVAPAPPWRPASGPPTGPPEAPVPVWASPPEKSAAGGSRFAPPWIVVALVAALVGGGAGAGIAEAVGTNTTTTAAPAVRVGQVTPGPALAGGAEIPTIVKSVLPEVVSIDARGPGGPGGGLFGTVEDQGTGMIITTTGEVLTNNHVISGATAITVTLYGQTNALPASLVGADPSSDVALLKLNSPPPNLQAVTFGDSTKLQVGDAVIAIGNALGLSAGTPTVTQGIISALGRTVQAGDTGGGQSETLQNMIQTDAAINSGNSGGPLVDSAGQVIGMNTAVASSSNGNAPAQNIGFAIPSSNLQGLLGTLRTGGTTGAAKAYLGVEVTDETPQQQQAYGLFPSQGALVVLVVGGSPAQNAGLRQGDVIVSFNGRAVNSAQDLTNAVKGSSPGKTVQVTLYRGQQRMNLSAKLATAPAS
jgi:S1-C subfamily serine protease